ncbi:phosphatidylinositol- -diphosphate 3-kinase, putative [Ichthyophthirius multifiliis]|uniref:Phosphatidylinositol--diphosphate 3-kinase, putative n=1 Tax=Ichthyophthirius multifiliis TaxID=5932 RepID=G0R493_ICHMU|nr:phosphatidylinositol- -diphosphate 3-kinase, putative [Ichthyophthirius multifiliis]EGR27704.1 phosphatidylinositol- -diphosphate 3-kinase, putative [Ichthyophthirius multifiliis]|eukprot:XP_004025156.1 phosphatidylinositol- -diphosphate 3-kinase, putative [Ichthyophthirius multifiliis]
MLQNQKQCQFKLSNNQFLQELVDIQFKIEKNLICVDPDSHQIYSLNQETNEFYIQLNVDNDYRQRAETAISEIEQITNLNKGNWIIDHEKAEQYRRRKIPNYLLQRTDWNHPTYICQSPLSQAFVQKKQITLLVNLSEFIDKLKKSNKYQEKIQVGNQGQQQPKKQKQEGKIQYLKIDVGLVTAADEVMKIIIRQIYQEYDIKLTPSPNHTFILKISGYREFLNGHYPMLSYDRVRTHLRADTPMKVLLLEKPNGDQKQKLFPPQIEKILISIVQKFKDKKISHDYSIEDILEFVQKKSQDVKQIFKDGFNFKIIDNATKKTYEEYNVNWEKLRNIPLLLWFKQYIYYINDFYIQKILYKIQMHKQNVLKVVYTILYVFYLIIQFYIFKKGQKMAKLFFGEGHPTELRLRVIHKERMKEFVEKRRNLFYQGVFSEKPTNLYSGECDCQFKIKIKGIENLYRLLQQTDHNSNQSETRASYNGILPPNYITKKGECQKYIIYLNYIQLYIFIYYIQIYFYILNYLQINKQIQDHGHKKSLYFKKLADLFDLNFPPYLIQIQVKIIYGNRQLAIKKETLKIPFSNTPRWNEWIKFRSLKISQLPLEARLCFDIIIYSCSGQESQVYIHILFFINKNKIIASTTINIFDQHCKFMQGINSLNLWPFYANEDRLACMGQYWGIIDPSLKPDPSDFDKWQQFKAYEFSRLFVEFDTFSKHMYWSLRDDKSMIQLGQLQYFINFILFEKKGFQPSKNRLEDLWQYTPQNQYLADLKDLLKRDPLDRQFDMRQKLILLICRNHFKSIPDALDTFLCAVDWSNPEHIRETYNLIKQWKPPPAEECITFLDVHHADELIRLFGVERLSKMADDELKLYMIELIQGLMFETYHYSPLQELLLERSLLNPFVVGHELFWGLKSQLHLKPSFERFALVLEQLLMVCGEYRNELLKEVQVNDEVKQVAKKIKAKKCQNANERIENTQQLLQELKFLRTEDQGIRFYICYRQQIIIKKFRTQKMQSHELEKLPLWLVMQNMEQGQEEFMIMFKDGDDLRQDLLTLQLIRIMDKIWLDAGQDLRMKPYNVISTQDQVGMLEIVLKSETTAKIHTELGQFGAFKKETILLYLRKNSVDENQKFDQKKFETNRENFINSCAGYCVATYVLGIGDRHSDNIMITKEGHLFHIDFGHFLGNFKKNFGFNRERCPFVFTPDMEYVLTYDKKDGQNFYEKFEQKCCDAYNLIRKHGHFLINIFRMMLSAGMPELQKQSDIQYLVDMLNLNLSEQEASQHFKNELIRSKNSYFRQVDNFIHEYVRK